MAEPIASGPARHLNVLGISGSLRRASFNTATLRAATELAPREMSIVHASIGDLPLYDEDLRASGWPPPVERFRRQVAASDAVLFVTPEYNYSVPGVLKNALDWASRPPQPPFAGKPAAIVGASPGRIGTARAQYHLRQICVFLDVHVLNRPELMIANAERLFTDGRLSDEETRRRLAELLAALALWTRRIAPHGPSAESPKSRGDEVHEASLESFPASDPPSFNPLKIG